MRHAIWMAIAPMTMIACISGGSGDPGLNDAGSGDASGDEALDAGSLASSEDCASYLGCILVTAPEAYGAALDLYGEGSACWQTPRQAEGCRQACNAALSKLAGQCECSGGECKKCVDPPRGDYSGQSAEMSCDDTGKLAVQWVDLSFEPPKSDRMASAYVRINFDNPPPRESPVLSGHVPCSGAFTLEGDGEGVGKWNVKLTPKGEGDTFELVATATNSTPDTIRVCTVSATVSRR